MNASAISARRAYSIDLQRYALPDAARISDVRLACALRMESADSSIDLLEVVDERTGEEYILRLCGTVSVVHAGRAFRAAAEEISAEMITTLELRAEERDEDIELLHTPWFEWVDSNGDLASVPLESIRTDPALEAAAFLAFFDALEKATHPAP